MPCVPSKRRTLLPFIASLTNFGPGAFAMAAVAVFVPSAFGHAVTVAPSSRTPSSESAVHSPTVATGAAGAASPLSAPARPLLASCISSSMPAVSPRYFFSSSPTIAFCSAIEKERPL